MSFIIFVPFFNTYNCLIYLTLFLKLISGDSIDDQNDSPEVRSVLDDVKRIRVNPPKDGRLYPTLSDIETTESERDYTTATVTESENDCLVSGERDGRHEKNEYYDEDDRWARFVDIVTDIFLFIFCLE